MSGLTPPACSPTDLSEQEISTGVCRQVPVKARFGDNLVGEGIETYLAAMQATGNSA
jgi:hypothetical protein